jgi:hypothetical protein
MPAVPRPAGCPAIRDRPEYDGSAVGQAWIADSIASGLSQSVGPLARATSPDNTIRYAATAESEWVLVDVHAHAAVDGLRRQEDAAGDGAASCGHHGHLGAGDLPGAGGAAQLQDGFVDDPVAVHAPG